MKNEEPGWVTENRSADELGWKSMVDPKRGAKWCSFVKDGEFVWRTSDGWVRANFDMNENIYFNHRKFSTLKEAFRG